MKENIDKHIENLVDKTMKGASLESPSMDFTAQVMSHVSELSQSRITVYRPLISRRFWVVIGIAIFATVIYLFLNTPTNEASWLNSINFEALRNNSISQALSNFTVSKTVMYSVVLFGIMMFIQVPILKNYFDNRMEAY